MKAVDTNVVVRYIVADDPAQTEIADRIIAEGVFLPLTVLLEVGWVLRSRYRFSRNQLADIGTQLLEVPTLSIEHEPEVRRWLDYLRSGADWADAIHLIAARGSDAFVTFDRALAAVQDTQPPVELGG